jgi:hypothetical protein
MQRREQLLERGAFTLRVDAQRAVLHQTHPSRQPKRLGSRPYVLAKRTVGDLPGDYDSPSRRLAHGRIIVGLDRMVA